MKGLLTSIALILLQACGDGGSNMAGSGSTQASEAGPTNIRLYSSKASLPTCNDAIRNYLGYVSDEKKLYACDGSSWSAVELGSSTAGAESDSESIIDIQTLATGSTQCAQGGILVKSGIDTDGDGKLSTLETAKQQSVCNGVAGTDGEDGLDGLDILDTYRYAISSYASAPNLGTASYIVKIGSIQVIEYNNWDFGVHVSGMILNTDSAGHVYSNDFAHSFQMVYGNSSTYVFSVKLDSYANTRLYYTLQDSSSGPSFSVSLDADGNPLNDTSTSYTLIKQ